MLHRIRIYATFLLKVTLLQYIDLFYLTIYQEISVSDFNMILKESVEQLQGVICSIC